MTKKTPKGSPSLPTPKTKNQKLYINAIETSPMVIALGPAGTGKSYLSATYAAHYLKTKRVNRIVITRPTVPTGRSIGYFPGSLEEKMEPWLKPIVCTIEDFLGKGDYECQRKNGNIEVVPFETIRGRSFDNAFIILDEAQNATVEEIKAFVTRIGEYSVAVINGDITQTDIGYASGLKVIVDLVDNSEDLQNYVPVIEFTSEDVVRSGLCQLWVQEFAAYDLGCKKRYSTEESIPSFLQPLQKT